MVHLSAVLGKYTDFSILRFLLQHSSTSFYVKELSKKLSVSPASVSKLMNSLDGCSIVVKEEVGNVHSYSLNNESPLVRQMKVFDTLLRFDEIQLIGKFLDLDEGISSIILYGSYADGSNDNKSDIDLLVVSETKADFSALLEKLSGAMNAEITLLQYKVSELNKLKREDSVFYSRLKETHILLYGAGLP